MSMMTKTVAKTILPKSVPTAPTTINALPQSVTIITNPSSTKIDLRSLTTPTTTSSFHKIPETISNQNSIKKLHIQNN